MGAWGLGVVAAAWLASPPAAARMDAAGGGGAFRVRIERPALASAVDRALRGAVRRLQSRTCSSLFADFKDANGRPLQAALDALEQTGAGYLTLIGFYDGQGHRTCHRGKTLAITAAGSRNVWICPEFALEQRRDPGLAEALLVHEALHSLGLGENPPSAAQITARVVDRCGR